MRTIIHNVSTAVDNPATESRTDAAGAPEASGRTVHPDISRGHHSASSGEHHLAEDTNATIPLDVPEAAAGRMAVLSSGPHNSGVVDDQVAAVPLADIEHSGADLDDPNPLGFAVAAVAQRLGLPPATLRTWDRRYGLGPSGRSIGGHRRYTGADILRLDLACRLMRQGLGPAVAAKVALDSDIAHTPVQSLGVAAVDDDCPVAGTRVEAETAVKGLLRAAYGLDAPACRTVIRATLDRRGVIWTWEQLLVPTLIEIGRRWQNTGEGVETEHLISAVIESELQAIIMATPATVNTRPVLIASAPEDMHTLPSIAIAAALAERHICTRVLGARTPIDALLAAIKRLGPSAVIVWSQLDSTGGPEVLEAIPMTRAQVAIIAAGPGWAADLPSGVERPVDLVDTVTRVTAAIR